jgi:hypothetical protein
MTVIKGISNFGTPYYADEPRYERKNGQWIDTKADIIAELEKIKAEIKDNYTTDVAEDIIWLIDEHIKELKGENNE